MSAEPEPSAPQGLSTSAAPKLSGPASAALSGATSSSAPRAQGYEIVGSKSRLERLLAYRLLLLLALGVLALDQASKLWIASQLDFGTYPGSRDALVVVDNFFYLVHVGNTGAAWSNFAGHSSLLALLAFGTLTAIFFWRHTLGLRSRVAQAAFGLLCGGIAGNLLDRLVHGHVVDFIDLHFGPHFPAMFNPYPTFNVADSGICVGTLLYVIHSLRQPK